MQSVKNAKIISYLGAIGIIVWALLKIFHFGLVNPNLLGYLSLLLVFIGQTWEIRILQELIKKEKSGKGQ